MTPPVGRAGAVPRLLQAAVFTAACLLLSAAGHTLVGGDRVPWWALAVGGVALLFTVTPLTGRERTLPAIAAGLAVGQLGLHLLFAGAAAPPSPGAHHAPGGSGGGHLRHLLHAGLTACELPMLLAHLLAALTTGWLLRRGQVALWRVLRLSTHTAEQLASRTALRAALRTALWWAAALAAGRWPAGRAVAAVPWWGTAPRGLPRPAELRHAVVRRGPPPAAARCAPAT